MRLRLWFIVPVSLVVPVLGLAQVRSFVPDLHESKWEVTASPLECRLSQTVPFYGTATFYKRAGGKLEFTIQVLQPALRETSARLTVIPPAWKHDASPLDMGEIPVSPGRRPFHLQQTRSRRLLAELEAGMFPTLTYNDWSEGQDRVKVALSAVNVREPLQSFFDCTNSLLPYDFDTIRESRFFFSSGGAKLSDEAKARLDKVAAYLRADKQSHRIKLTGYTDTRGFRRYNYALGMRRAKSVQDYLVAKGVPANLFILHSKGERRPQYNNRSSRGRMMNRRVDVVVEK
jgi:outer membrane protein OmpA-like peptidoglycan-associated protein